MYGHTDALQSRLKAKPHLLNMADKYGYTALHYAAQNDHTDIVRLLLERNADPNACVCGATPLHRAGTFIKAYVHTYIHAYISRLPCTNMLSTVCM